MGVTLGVLQNQDCWMGEGDDMMFVDDETKPVITGTGTEDYFNGAWDFGGRRYCHTINGAPFIGAPLIVNGERPGGRYCLYRWHADNPVTFSKYLKHTIEHGHADHRADNFSFRWLTGIRPRRNGFSGAASGRGREFRGLG